MACRAAYLDRVRSAGVTLSASSSQSALPPSYVADQLRSKVWRSKVGYNVVAGFNDSLEYDSGGGEVSVTLTAGNYSTPALYAAHVQAALLASGLTGATCSYDSATAKFTIGASGAFSILWLTGTNAATSAGKDLGFDTTADDGSATSHVADSASYHSREWILADLGSALAAQFVAAVDHNFSAGATVTAEMNASDSWGSPSVSQALTVGDELALAYLSAEQTYRYHRLLVEDVGNSDGYSELGVWCVAPYTQPAVSFSQGFTLSPDDLSMVVQGDQGAHFQDIGEQRDVWQLEWTDIEESDRDALWAIWQSRRVGGCFFFTFDSGDVLDTTLYCYMPDEPTRPHSTGDYYHLNMRIAEALG